MEKVYVLVRTYNSALYVKKAIESALNQDYQNLEVIVFDDGSTDDTTSVISSLNSSRITIGGCKTNMGAAHALVGILDMVLSKASNEDYIFFLDSDDSFLSYKSVSNVIKQMKETEANLCFITMKFSGDSSFILQPGMGQTHISVVDKVSSHSSAVNALSCPEVMNADTTTWSKVYKAEVLQQYRSILPAFPEGIYTCSDFTMATVVLLKDVKITAFKEPVYNFYKHGGSITAHPKEKHFYFDRVTFLRFCHMMVHNNKEMFIPTASEKIDNFISYKHEVIGGIIKKKIETGDVSENVIEKFEQEYAKIF